MPSPPFNPNLPSSIPPPTLLTPSSLQLHSSAPSSPSFPNSRHHHQQQQQQQQQHATPQQQQQQHTPPHSPSSSISNSTANFSDTFSCPGDLDHSHESSPPLHRHHASIGGESDVSPMYHQSNHSEHSIVHSENSDNSQNSHRSGLGTSTRRSVGYNSTPHSSHKHVYPRSHHMSHEYRTKRVNFKDLSNDTIMVQVRQFNAQDDPYTPFEVTTEPGHAISMRKPRTRDGKRKVGFLNCDGLQVHQPSLRYRVPRHGTTLYGADATVSPGVAYNYDAFLDPETKARLIYCKKRSKLIERYQQAAKVSNKPFVEDEWPDLLLGLRRLEQQYEADEQQRKLLETKYRHDREQQLAEGRYNSYTSPSTRSHALSTSSHLISDGTATSNAVSPNTLSQSSDVQNNNIALSPSFQSPGFRPAEQQQQPTSAPSMRFLGPYYSSLFREVSELIGFNLAKEAAALHIAWDSGTNSAQSLSSLQTTTTTTATTATENDSNNSIGHGDMTHIHDPILNDSSMTIAELNKNAHTVDDIYQGTLNHVRLHAQRPILLHSALKQHILYEEYNAIRAKLVSATLARAIALSIFNKPQLLNVATDDYDIIPRWFWVDLEGSLLHWSSSSTEPKVDEKPGLFRRLFSATPETQEVLRVEKITLGQFQRAGGRQKKAKFKSWHCITITFNNSPPKSESKREHGDSKHQITPLSSPSSSSTPPHTPTSKDKQQDIDDDEISTKPQPLVILDPIEILCEDDEQTRRIFMGLQALCPLSPTTSTYGDFLWTRSSLKMRRLAFDKVMLKHEYASMLWERALNYKYQRFKRAFFLQQKINALRWVIAQITILCGSQGYFELINGMINLSHQLHQENQVQKDGLFANNGIDALFCRNEHGFVEVNWTRIQGMLSILHNDGVFSADSAESTARTIAAQHSKEELEQWRRLLSAKKRLAAYLEMCYNLFFPVRTNLNLKEVIEARIFLKRIIRRRFLASAPPTSSTAVATAPTTASSSSSATAAATTTTTNISDDQINDTSNPQILAITKAVHTSSDQFLPFSSSSHIHANNSSQNILFSSPTTTTSSPPLSSQISPSSPSLSSQTSPQLTTSPISPMTTPQSQLSEEFNVNEFTNLLKIGLYKSRQHVQDFTQTETEFDKEQQNESKHANEVLSSQISMEEIEQRRQKLHNLQKTYNEAENQEKLHSIISAAAAGVAISAHTHKKSHPPLHSPDEEVCLDEVSSPDLDDEVNGDDDDDNTGNDSNNKKNNNNTPNNNNNKENQSLNHLPSISSPTRHDGQYNNGGNNTNRNDIKRDDYLDSPTQFLLRSVHESNHETISMLEQAPISILAHLQTQLSDILRLTPNFINFMLVLLTYQNILDSTANNDNISSLSPSSPVHTLSTQHTTTTPAILSTSDRTAAAAAAASTVGEKLSSPPLATTPSLTTNHHLTHGVLSPATTDTTSNMSGNSLSTQYQDLLPDQNLALQNVIQRTHHQQSHQQHPVHMEALVETFGGRSRRGAISRVSTDFSHDLHNGNEHDHGNTTTEQHHHHQQQQQYEKNTDGKNTDSKNSKNNAFITSQNRQRIIRSLSRFTTELQKQLALEVEVFIAEGMPVQPSHKTAPSSALSTASSLSKGSVDDSVDSGLQFHAIRPLLTGCQHLHLTENIASQKNAASAVQMIMSPSQIQYAESSNSPLLTTSQIISKLNITPETVRNDGLSNILTKFTTLSKETHQLQEEQSDRQSTQIPLFQAIGQQQEQQDGIETPLQQAPLTSSSSSSSSSSSAVAATSLNDQTAASRKGSHDPALTTTTSHAETVLLPDSSLLPTHNACREHDLNTVDFLQHVYQLQTEQLRQHDIDYRNAHHGHQRHLSPEELNKETKIVEFVAYLRAAMYPHLTGFERELLHEGFDIRLIMKELLQLSPGCTTQSELSEISFKPRGK